VKNKETSFDNKNLGSFISIQDNDIEEKKVFEEKYLRIIDGIELLGDKCKILIIENILNGKSLDEIAPLINISKESMRVTKHRCIRKLRRLVPS